MPEFIIENMQISRGGRKLLRGLSFGLNSGELLKLTGNNGVGKTSLMQILAGLSIPDQGDARLNGVSLIEDQAAYRDHIGYLGHQDNLKSDLTINENLSFWAHLYGGELAGGDAGRIPSLLTALGLNMRKDQRVSDLSVGLKRRTAIARLALLDDKALWLMDEPLSGLDDESRSAWAQIITAYLDAGGMCIVSAHDDLPLSPSKQLKLDDYRAGSA
ncbi:MAG: heme ABC exporter ATP-binding protein CcmA [Alphaproteobacteria bacterium]